MKRRSIFRIVGAAFLSFFVEKRKTTQAKEPDYPTTCEVCGVKADSIYMLCDSIEFGGECGYTRRLVLPTTQSSNGVHIFCKRHKRKPRILILEIVGVREGSDRKAKPIPNKDKYKYKWGIEE